MNTNTAKNFSQQLPSQYIQSPPYQYNPQFMACQQQGTSLMCPGSGQPPPWAVSIWTMLK